MSEEIELARRAVACDGWRWMPGMLIRNADGPVRIDAVDGTQPGVLRKSRFTNSVYVADVRCGPRPDFTDPATLGCVLALVAERHGVSLDDVYASKVGGGGWSVWVFDGEEQRCAWPQWRVTYSTRRAALIAALEAAPVVVGS